MAIQFTLRQLEYFDAVASAGSLAGAAEHCHVSPTALALALDELERRLGLQLFIRRKGKGVTVSPAGAALVQHAREVLSGAEAFSLEAAQGATGLTGRLSIGCFATLGPFFLPALLDVFARDHADLEIQITEASSPELEELVLQGRVDAALLYGADVSSHLEFEPLHEFAPTVIVSASHALAGRRSVSLAELAPEPLIQIDMQPSLKNTEHMFASLDLTPEVRYKTTDYELARCLVGRGVGYSVVFQRPIPSTTYDGHDIATLEIHDTLPRTVVGLARPQGASRTAKYAALHDFFLALPVPGSGKSGGRQISTR
jgi:DNA-binding transcriptional LysR family regulator